MNKTIYIPDEYGDLWEEARRLSEGSISKLFLDFLQKYVAEKKSQVHECINEDIGA